MLWQSLLLYSFKKVLRQKPLLSARLKNMFNHKIFSRPYLKRYSTWWRRHKLKIPFYSNRIAYFSVIRFWMSCKQSLLEWKFSPTCPLIILAQECIKCLEYLFGFMDWIRRSQFFCIKKRGYPNEKNTRRKICY